MPGLWTAFQIKSNGTPSGTIANWNDFTGTSLPTTLSSNVYEDNTSSPVTLTLDGAYTGQGNVGVNAANGLFEALVRVSCFYITTGTQTWAFGGLDNSKTYEVRFLGSRAGSATNRIGEMTYGGTTVDIDSAGDHSSEIGTWTGLSPSSGIITGSYVVKSGSSYAYSNGMIIREEDAAGATLSADSGTYTYTGTAAALEAAFDLTAASGTYTYTGATVGLDVGFDIIADSGTYTYTGTAVTLTFGATGAFTLTADSGTYAYTGTAAELDASFQLSANSGTYTYTGTAVALNQGFDLAANSGTYTYTGNTVAFVYNRVMSADTGSYVYTGTSVTLSTSGQVWVVQADSTDTWSAQSNSSDVWTIEA